jgi:thioredoxin-like negative regulator of GroEL
VAAALALASEDAKALALADEVAKSRPEATWVQSVDVPAVRAVTEMNHGNAAKAAELLDAAKAYDRNSAEALYIHAEAYLKANQASNAEPEFQSIIALKNHSPADALISLAHFGPARASALEGDKTKARTAYEDFSALSKDADLDLPILKEAKAEYAKFAGLRSSAL